MFLNDSVADRKTKASASTAGLGGKKRIKNSVNMLARNPCTGVYYFNFHATVVRAGPHFQNAPGRHRIPGIQKQIQKYLLQLICGAAYSRQAFAQILYDLNLRSLQRM